MSTKDEIKKLIKESVSEIWDQKDRRKRNIFVEIGGIILTPIVIASVSLIVTYKINEAQKINTERIAEAQIQSAENIAAAQRKHTAQIAGAEREVQRLRQIEEIFREIIKIRLESQNLETTKTLIESLTVHRETSLPFLVRIRDHFADQNSKDLQQLSRHARETIAAVLSNNHLSFEKMDFSGKENEPRILRYARLQDYNLSGAIFNKCNLFRATFMRSSLSGASFKDSDLFGADFSEAKLDGAIFDKANLRHAVFTGSKIDNAKFEKAVNLEDASFSLLSRLKDHDGKNPFKNVKDDTVLKLLVEHIDELKEISPENENLKEFLKRFETIVTYQDLIENLEKRRNVMKISSSESQQPNRVSQAALGPWRVSGDG